MKDLPLSFFLPSFLPFPPSPPVGRRLRRAGAIFALHPVTDLVFLLF